MVNAYDGSSTDSEGKKLQDATASRLHCHHWRKALDTAALKKLLKKRGLAEKCEKCNTAGSALQLEEEDGFEFDNTLWLCLRCGSQLCGRSKNKHALEHFKTPHSDSHALSMNTRSHAIWCYECDAEVESSEGKGLQECVQIVKKLCQQPLDEPVLNLSNLPSATEIQNKIAATWEHINPLVHSNDASSITTATNKSAYTSSQSAPIPGMAKRVNESIPLGYSPLNSTAAMLGPQNKLNAFAVQPDMAESLPRVRGLTNLGNTCFFNAVLQCLAQTPYLLEVLKETSEPGEEFVLPGGTFKFKDDENLELPMIKGTLSSWGSLTYTLAQTLEELQSGGGVYNPSKLFDKLCNKCPQFHGGDQHDSHELLRQLLESVRAEDLKRYQRVILQNLGYKDQDISTVSEELRQKCKIYGNQAADRIMRPEQVFRGFLVSTLTCQECYNVSPRHENFLDLSVPVTCGKPQPPQRLKSRENSPENSLVANSEPSGPTKSQLKKERQKERKAKRVAKHQNNKQARKILHLNNTTANTTEDNGGVMDMDIESDTPTVIGCATREEAAGEGSASDGSSSEQSDADVEDNLIDDNPTTSNGKKNVRPAIIGPQPLQHDTNGNNHIKSPSNPEKRDDLPENVDKDMKDDENDSGIATSPANGGNSFPASGNKRKVFEGKNRQCENSICALALSEKGRNIVRQLSLGEKLTEPPPMTNGLDDDDDEALATQIEQVQLKDEEQQQQQQQMVIRNEKKKAKRVRTNSVRDWSTTIAPRYQCEDNECSIQSCLTNFTAVELMAGQNKVGCENCTKLINGTDPKAKTVYSNATKHFLISSPPAVLILHLKRFHIGPRNMYRKLTRAVSFPLVLDLAPFCGSKVKNLPNVDRKQKKLLYALYGIVEHSGSMYGGHYTAYVKVRPKLSPDDKRWKFIPQGSKAELDQDDEQVKKLEETLAKRKARDLRMKMSSDSDDYSHSSSSVSNSSSSTEQDETSAPESEPQGAVGGDEEASDVQVPMGKWYFVSDSRVQECSEETVLKAQAYLLFYERIY